MTRPLIGSAAINEGNINNSIFNGGSVVYATISGGILTNTIDASSGTISGATISGGTISGATISSGNSLLYAGSKVLVSYTGSITEPILIPNGGAIGNDSSSLTLCGVTLTGGDFTKLKNLQ